MTAAGVKTANTAGANDLKHRELATALSEETE